MRVPRACAFLTGFVLSFTTAMLSAKAASVTFDWSATSTASAMNGGFAFTGNGTVTVTTGPGGDLVTNITGFLTNGSVVDTITGVGPIGSGSPFTMTNNMIYPVGTTFMGPPVTAPGVSYTSASDLDNHGLAINTTGGVFVFLSTVVPNSTLPPSGPNIDEEFTPTSSGGVAFAGVGSFVLTPLPAALPLFATGLGAIGLLGWRMKRKARAVA